MINNIEICREWQRFYKKYFNLNVNFAGVRIPTSEYLYDRVILIPAGLTYLEIIKALEAEMLVKISAHDVDENENKNLRNPDRSYAVWVQEEGFTYECIYFSMEKFNNNLLNSITLLERLVYELKYFIDTKKHLDTDEGHGVTYCAGTVNKQECKIRVTRFDVEKNELHIFYTQLDLGEESFFGRTVAL